MSAFITVPCSQPACTCFRQLGFHMYRQRLVQRNHGQRDAACGVQSSLYPTMPALRTATNNHSIRITPSQPYSLMDGLDGKRG